MAKTRKLIVTAPKSLTGEGSPGWFSRLKAGLNKPGINAWDWLHVLISITFAIMYFLGRLQDNYPVVVLSGDAGNIASFAAASDHPDWFTNDAALGNSNNRGIYATIHVPIIRLLNNLTHDYAQAYAWLAPVQTFLQLLGFYLLGRVLFKNRFWAFLFAFLTAMPVITIGLGESWGVLQDALPRVTFQSLLPFLLTLVFTWKDHPQRWPWLMLFTGLLVYAHPISAPAWGLSIWASLWLLHPKTWTWKRRLSVMFGLGLLFLITLAPFVVNYASYRGRDQLADYSTVMTILETYSPANLLNVPAALGNFLWNMTRNLLLPVGLVGIFLTWNLKKTDRLPVRVVLVWMAGIILSSVVIPFVEGLINRYFHILPFETELVRGIRYFVPLLLLFWLWPLSDLAARLGKPLASTAMVGLAVVLFTFWGITNHPAVGDMLDAVTCFTNGNLVCSSGRPVDELILTLRSSTDPGDGVLVFNENTTYTSQSLSVRYSALRPLVYSLRDSGILGYSDRTALTGWLDTTNQVNAIRSMSDPVQRLEALVPLAESLGAKYLVVDFAVPADVLTSLLFNVVMQNEGFLLIKLQ